MNSKNGAPCSGKPPLVRHRRWPYPYGRLIGQARVPGVILVSRSYRDSGKSVREWVADDVEYLDESGREIIPGQLELF